MGSVRALRLSCLFVGCCAAWMSGACRSASPLETAANLGGGPAAAQVPATLAAAGTVTTSLPAGEGMDAVRIACVVCHAPAMLLQQRLTAQQWLTEIDKMQAWGARVSAADKPAMVNYLVTMAGRDNTRFAPAVVAPIPNRVTARSRQ